MLVFGSQALDVAIGLIVSFFVLALASSGAVELISRLRNKRGNLLDKVMAELIPASKLEKTSAVEPVATAPGKTVLNNERKPSYIAASSFANGVTELLIELGEAAEDVDAFIESLPEELRSRLRSIVTEVGEDLTAIKAGLETWFDATMDRLEGSYKRWVTAWIFWIGLAITIGANVPAFHVAQDLWGDSAARAAVVEAADQLVISQDPEAAGDGTRIETFADAVEALDYAGLPVGWDDEAIDRFTNYEDLGTPIAVIAGWLVTATLITLGAPFWYDLLTRLVSLRWTGSKPAAAVEDLSSATTARVTANAVEGSPRGRRTTWAEDLYRAVGGR